MLAFNLGESEVGTWLLMLRVLAKRDGIEEVERGVELLLYLLSLCRLGAC